MRAFYLALLLSGCVEETVVLGDQRPMHACDEAVTLTAPSAGCTTIDVASMSPFGCLVTDPTGTHDHAGSWVHLALVPGQTAFLHVALEASTTACPSDAGTSPCPVTATVRSGSGTPCACELGSTRTYAITSSDMPIPLTSPASEVLLEPLGARFSVSLCAGP